MVNMNILVLEFYGNISKISVNILTKILMK